MRLVSLTAATLLSLALPGSAVRAQAGTSDGGHPALTYTRDRLAQDEAALASARPSYPFWAHVFTIPDGAIAYGSAEDGRLLAQFPSRGDWRKGAFWADATLEHALDGASLDRNTRRRRDQVAEVLEERTGPVVHNATRGDFLRPARTYGAFLEEWATIYERFGVPADIGLAQDAVESGFSGTIRSSANALGLCQWLKPNWARLDRLTPNVIEIQNQTTQAAYCAAYLTVMATKYGSFIPALSEHHAGIANVGKVIFNGGRLGAQEVRDRYFTGADFARDLRAISARRYRAVVGTYGTRSFLYAEMVFGNTPNVRRLRETIPQERVYAIRTDRNRTMSEITRITGLSKSEVKRFNPALFRRVPKGATIYLPEPVTALGTDVSFWHEPVPESFAEVLDDFVRLDASLEEWEDPSFGETLSRFRKRFRDSASEEGVVMDAVLAYMGQDLSMARKVMTEYRRSAVVRRSFEEGVQRRQMAQTEAERLH